MKANQYLIQDGNTSRIKNQASLVHVILVAWLLIGIALLVYSSYINEQGKEQELGLMQHFFKKPVQQVLNDIDEILNNEHQR